MLCGFLRRHDRPSAHHLTRQMSSMKRSRDELDAASSACKKPLEPPKKPSSVSHNRASASATSVDVKERDKLISQVELQVMKHQRSFDALSTALEKLRDEEAQEKFKLEALFDKKKQQQVVAPRRALLAKIKGFWPAVLMKIVSDDNSPLRVQGSALDFPALSHVTDFMCATSHDSALQNCNILPQVRRGSCGL